MGLHVSCPTSRLWMTVIVLLSRTHVTWSAHCCVSVVDWCDNHPSCCETQQTVNSSTVRFYEKVKSTHIGWSVTANITWERPPGRYFDGYAVEAEYIRDDYNPSCDLDNPIYQLTTMEWIFLEDLRFGYDLDIYVYSANLTARIRNQGTPDIKRVFELPDCYETTKDLHFCQTQEVLVPSKPIGLRVDDVTPLVDPGKATPVAKLTVFWHPPAQLPAGKLIGEFEVRVDRADGRYKRVVEVVVPTPSQMMYTNPFNVSFEKSFELDVPFNWTETIEITVQGFLNSNNKSCRTNSRWLRCDGRKAFYTRFYNITTEPLVPSSDIWIVVAGCSGALVVLLVLICFTFRSRRARPDMKSPKDTAPKPAECFLNKEFDRTLLRSITEIGRGSFGIVYKGSAFGSLKGVAGFYPVAVKSIKGNATAEMQRLFLNEIELMIEIGSHPNIISLLGCCTVEEPYLLLTNFMEYGDLLHFLWKSRESKAAEDDPIYKVTELPKLQIARQIARGMEYISTIRYYHGDLAARNVLVGGNLQIKVSDFGLAADIYEQGYKRLKSDDKRPVKWASLETNTTGKCSIESDVWSFGIVLYEIFTLGDVPYQGIEKSELIPELKRGYRLDQPEDCPLEVYDIMRQCWLEYPMMRPSFTKLTELLESLMAKHSDYMDLEESAASMDGVKSEPACQSNEMSNLSGVPDELNLWLHVTGEIPESARTLDFVSFAEEATISGDGPVESVDLKNLQFGRFRDSDILTESV